MMNKHIKGKDLFTKYPFHHGNNLKEFRFREEPNYCAKDLVDIIYPKQNEPDAVDDLEVKRRVYRIIQAMYFSEKTEDEIIRMLLKNR